MTCPDSPSAILLTSGGPLSNPPRHLGHRSLLPLLDKPLLQRATETLVRLGCQDVHVFLDESPAEIRDFLGNGERWGITVTYHYFDGSQSLASNLKPLQLPERGSFWLANSEIAPLALSTASTPPTLPPGTLLAHEQAGTTCWTGWGHFDTALLAGLDANVLPGAPLPAAPAGLTLIVTPERIDVRTDADYLDSCRLLLAQPQGANPAGIRLGRGARVHPSARLTGPVHIGANARIEAGAEIGPYAVIGEDASVEKGAEVTQSIVLPGTYVGEGLLLEEAIAAPGKLVSIRNGTVLEDIEPHLLTASRPQTLPQSLGEKLGLVGLQVLLFPIWGLARLLLAAAGCRTSTPASLRLPQRSLQFRTTQRSVSLPLLSLAHHETPGQTHWLAHFARTFYPGLQAVRQRDIQLFGLQLRDQSELAWLPHHWRELYALHPCGLLNESMLHPGAPQDSPLRYASDICAAAGLPRATQRRILGRYLRCVFSDLVQVTLAALGSKPKSGFSSHS